MAVADPEPLIRAGPVEQGHHDFVHYILTYMVIRRRERRHLDVYQFMHNGALHSEPHLAAFEMVAAGIEHTDRAGAGRGVPFRGAPGVAVDFGLASHSQGQIPIIQTKAPLPRLELTVEPHLQRADRRTR